MQSRAPKGWGRAALAVFVSITVMGACAQVPQTASSTATPTEPPGATASPIATPLAKTRDPVASPPPPSTVLDLVTINGRAFRIGPADAVLWRDFMPITPPGGQPLAASIRVMAIDGGSFPQDITVDQIWVHGPSVWETAPAEVRRSPAGDTPPSKIEAFANGGPKWDPGIEVDVVIRLLSRGATYFLRATGVKIDLTS